MENKKSRYTAIPKSQLRLAVGDLVLGDLMFLTASEFGSFLDWLRFADADLDITVSESEFAAAAAELCVSTPNAAAIFTPVAPALLFWFQKRGWRNQITLVEMIKLHTGPEIDLPKFIGKVRSSPSIPPSPIPRPPIPRLAETSIP